VLAALVGKLGARRKDCAPLAGKSTLNRLEHAPLASIGSRVGEGGPNPVRRPIYHKLGHDGAAIEGLFVDLFLEAHKAPPKEIILGVDHEVITTFVPAGSGIYVDRVLAAEDEIARPLVGNPEWLVIGALPCGSNPGTVDEIKRPFTGTVEVVGFLTRAEADALLHPQPEPEPEPEPDPRIAELQAILIEVRGKSVALTADVDAALDVLNEEI
jgi:hypothetical protein